MIRLRTLGSLDLRGSNGEELRTVLVQPKRSALLVYLAIAAPRGPHRRDTLLALFWPELDADHARNALNQAVHFLRRSLGAESIVNRGEGELAVNPGSTWCDVVAFEDALDAQRLDEAVDLYRGDLLEGFHVGAAAEFDHWLETERARLASRYGAALVTLAERCESAGAHAAAVGWWRRLAARDPFNSAVAVRLMRALAAAGDPAAAIQHARIHVTLLRGELDVAPPPEVEQLVRQLEAGPPAPADARSQEDAESPGSAHPPAPVQEPRVRQGSRARRLGIATAAAVLALVVLVTREGRSRLLGHAPAGGAESAVIRSIAVLPFDVLSVDSEQHIFADGMHDMLITELARYPELSVTSRTSTIRYRDSQKPIAEIARELKVDGIVEGSVMRDGARVRMTAQLVHGPTDRHLWAEHYQRDLRDVLQLQEELAEAIARAVRVVTRPQPRPGRQAVGPRDSFPDELHLRELYLRGRHAELSRSHEGLRTAKEAYSRAIERDSTFALGYAGLAAVHGFLADYDFAPRGPSLDSAHIMARRAVTLDSMVPETRTALAVTLGDAHDFEAAEREFRRAIELGPSNARAHYWYSVLLVALGRGEEALREANRAKELDPFAPRGVTGMIRYATWLTTGERPHLALPVPDQRPILKLEPGEPWARGRDAYEYARAGDCGNARIALVRARNLAPESRRMHAFAASVHWLCGDTSQARAIVEAMKRRPDAYDHGFRIALPYVVFGEYDSAFAWLNRHRWTMAELTGLRADALLDSIRPDPRYVQLLQRIGVRPMRAAQNR